MFRKILMIVLLNIFAFSTFAQQVESKESSEAYIYATFKEAKDEDVKVKTEPFYNELKKDLKLEGYIVIYGTPKLTLKRRKQIMKGLNWRCHYNCPNILFVEGGGEKFKTEFWIVPFGAKPPKF